VTTAPHPKSLLTLLGEDLWALACSVGQNPIWAERVTPLPSGDHAPNPMSRVAFRLAYPDGRQLKARRHRDLDTARRIVDLRFALDPMHLAPLLAAEGPCHLTEWVEGTLPDPDDPKVLTDVGVLLGTLHAAELGGDSLRHRFPYESWVDRNRRNMVDLTDAGVLKNTEVEEVWKRLKKGAPSSVQEVVIHADLAPENLVVAEDGRLVLVDNENMAVDAPGFDLARTWYRWPMDPRRWSGFLRGYERQADPAPFLEFAEFWTIVVLLEAAHFRVLGGTPRASVPLDLLRRVLSGTLNVPGGS